VLHPADDRASFGHEAGSVAQSPGDSSQDLPATNLPESLRVRGVRGELLLLQAADGAAAAAEVHLRQALDSARRQDAPFPWNSVLLRSSRGCCAIRGGAATRWRFFGESMTGLPKRSRRRI
jgi:hypothetical protein